MSTRSGFDTFDGLYNAFTNVLITASIAGLIAVFKLISKTDIFWQQAYFTIIILLYLIGLFLHFIAIYNALYGYAREGEATNSPEPRDINKTSARCAFWAFGLFTLVIVLEIIGLVYHLILSYFSPIFQVYYF